VHEGAAGRWVMLAGTALHPALACGFCIILVMLEVQMPVHACTGRRFVLLV
jgi:hypothetical protein